MGKAFWIVLALALVCGTAFAEIQAPNVVQISDSQHSFKIGVINTSSETQKVRISFLGPFEYTISPSNPNIRPESITIYTIEISPKPELSQQTYVGTLKVKIGDDYFQKKIEFHVAKISSVQLSEENQPNAFAALGDVNWGKLFSPSLPSLEQVQVNPLDSEIGPIEFLVDVIFVLCIAILAVALVARVAHRKKAGAFQ
ncbi:MAG: hypothetical protein V1977_00775 [Candidatus Diapherotrites archaeon]